jgi:CheY-like chemotaxis protein/HPt (histidine-containing phosphotransfer) domain-containing protein
VLLAEDNPVNQVVSVGMLEGIGCRVDVANNGREAFNALSRMSYDVVFMDCQMPVMDGFEATKAIRERERSSGNGGNSPTLHVPIVALTAHAMRGDREACLAAGMDDYMSKPFSQQQLVAVLKKWFTGRVPEKSEDKQPGNHGSETVLSIPGKRMKEESPSAAGKSDEPVQEPIDRMVLDTISSLQRPGSPDILKRVITLFIDDSAVLVRKLREGIHAGDPAVVFRAAHTMKSSSANVGAFRLSALCKELEMMGRNGSLLEAGELMSQIDDEYGPVLKALAREIERRG